MHLRQTPDRMGRAALPDAIAALGLASLSAPTLVLLLRRGWSDEQAQLGPLVLVLGIWMIRRRWSEVTREGRPGRASVAAAAATAAGAAYLIGRTADVRPLEAYGLYAWLLAGFYAVWGSGGLRQAGFGLAMIGFAAPVPFYVGLPVTIALRTAISEATVRLFSATGVPAGRDGLTLFLGSYRIDIAQACSGMNSLLALSAIGLCYLYLRRNPSLRRVLVLLPLIVLFAIGANFLRVFALAALTLVLGDVQAQGPLHQVIGFMAFGLAVALTMAADEAVALGAPPAPHASL